YTAYPIDEQQFTQVVLDMEAHFKSRLKARQVVAPELIGGVKVEVGDQVLDLSVQGRLNSLHTALMN
ncbi:F0F1-type ATP synthase, delta subunit, partial [Snodgrassella alvi SCGC AB-598-P14]